MTRFVALDMKKSRNECRCYCSYDISNVRQQLFHFFRMLIQIGMVSAEFLDWLDAYVRQIRCVPDSAFGGIQLAVCGDFLQLAPVPNPDVLHAEDRAPKVRSSCARYVSVAHFA